MQDPQGMVCPKCRGRLQAEAPGELRCGACLARYPLIDGIPSFIMAPGPPTPLPGCALTVVIPALNEAANLEEVLPIVAEALAGLGVSHEVIVVDGGSTDGNNGWPPPPIDGGCSELVTLAGQMLSTERGHYGGF